MSRNVQQPGQISQLCELHRRLALHRSNGGRLLAALVIVVFWKATAPSLTLKIPQAGNNSLALKRRGNIAALRAR
jgi:hypothetical protein